MGIALRVIAPRIRGRLAAVARARRRWMRSPGPLLTVINYDDWCTVSVAGQPTSGGPNQVVTVTPGPITLVAKAASPSFEIAMDMWHDTDGDTGAGETGLVSGTSSTATVTVATTPKCAWVCCPFTDGTGCTGLTDQALAR